MAVQTQVNDHSDSFRLALATAIPNALEKIGITAEAYAKRICPVGTPESTGIPGYIGGTLRNSITHDVRNAENAVYIGTNVEYAPYVELGTSKRRAKPYLRPAAEDHVDEYRRLIEEELKNV